MEQTQSDASNRDYAMKYDCILVNGDSYTAKSKFFHDKTYSDFLSEKLGIPVKNVAVRGSSNNRLTRSSIEYIHELRENHQTPLVLIGWSFVHRIEVWYEGTKKEILNTIPDIEINPKSKLITLDWMFEAKEATLEHKVLIEGYSRVQKPLTDFYTNLYMFGNLLESMNLKYCFFSAADNSQNSVHYWPHVHTQKHAQWVINNPNIFKLHEFSIFKWAKENDPECSPVSGHLSERGHEKFADFIIENLL